jgi:hypothetical protein
MEGTTFDQVLSVRKPRTSSRQQFLCVCIHARWAAYPYSQASNASKHAAPAVISRRDVSQGLIALHITSIPPGRLHRLLLDPTAENLRSEGAHCIAWQLWMRERWAPLTTCPREISSRLRHRIGGSGY